MTQYYRTGIVARFGRHIAPGESFAHSNGGDYGQPAGLIRPIDRPATERRADFGAIRARLAIGELTPGHILQNALEAYFDAGIRGQRQFRFRMNFKEADGPAKITTNSSERILAQQFYREGRVSVAIKDARSSPKAILKLELVGERASRVEYQVDLGVLLGR